MGVWDWLLGRAPKQPARKRPGGQAKLYVIVGQKGSGKTTYGIKLAKRLNKSVLVYTYTSDRTAYKNYIRVFPEKVNKISDEKGLYIIDDKKERVSQKNRNMTIDTVLNYIYLKFWDGTLLVDDAGALLRSYVNQGMLNILMLLRN